MRGTGDLYHIEDGHETLALAAPGFPKGKGIESAHKQLNRIQYEWHFGMMHPDSERPVLPEIVSAAMAVPDSMIVITQRAMPKPNGDLDFEKQAFACLKGIDFASFIRSKGDLDPAKVVWYRNVAREDNFFFFYSWLLGYELEASGVTLPVFKNAKLYTPCLPIYSYPFKTVPMATEEYSPNNERQSLLPLDQDYDDDSDGLDDSGDDDDDGGPNDPSGPVHTVDFSDLVPA